MTKVLLFGDPTDRTLMKEKKMILIKKSIFVATLLAIVAANVRAEQPVTHHFSIVRPPAPVITGVPVDFEITARLEDNKINKKADGTLLIQTTNGQSGTSQTVDKEAVMKHGVARVTLSFLNVGPNILQVTDKANSTLTNSASISVLPQPRKREVRP